MERSAALSPGGQRRGSRIANYIKVTSSEVTLRNLNLAWACDRSFYGFSDSERPESESIQFRIHNGGADTVAVWTATSVDY